MRRFCREFQTTVTMYDIISSFVCQNQSSFDPDILCAVVEMSFYGSLADRE